MLETFLAKYGYIAILLGTAFEGETIMIMGGFQLDFKCHRPLPKKLTYPV